MDNYNEELKICKINLEKSQQNIEMLLKLLQQAYSQKAQSMSNVKRLMKQARANTKKYKIGRFNIVERDDTILPCEIHEKNQPVIDSPAVKTKPVKIGRFLVEDASDSDTTSETKALSIEDASKSDIPLIRDSVKRGRFIIEDASDSDDSSCTDRNCKTNQLNIK